MSTIIHPLIDRSIKITFSTLSIGNVRPYTSFAFKQNLYLLSSSQNGKSPHIVPNPNLKPRNVPNTPENDHSFRQYDEICNTYYIKIYKTNVALQIIHHEVCRVWIVRSRAKADSRFISICVSLSHLSMIFASPSCTARSIRDIRYVTHRKEVWRALKSRKKFFLAAPYAVNQTTLDKRSNTP